MNGQNSISTIEQLSQALGNTNAQAYLRMLQQAEGTYRGAGGNPYATAFGGGQLPDLRQHPRKLHSFTQTDGKPNKTSAAGAYQFLSSTWDDVAGKLGLQDFGPRSQDLAALELMRRNGSLPDVLAGNFGQAVKKDGKTWASLPSSPYAQPKRSQGFVERALNSVIPSAGAAELPAQAGPDARGAFEQAMRQYRGAQVQGAPNQRAPSASPAPVMPSQSQAQSQQQAAPTQQPTTTADPRAVFEQAMQQFKAKKEEAKPGMLEAGGMGVLRGAKDVIDTGAQWLASGFDKLAGTNEGGRVRQMNEAGKTEFDQRYGSSTAADIGRFAGNVAATLPVGGVIGKGVQAVGNAVGMGAKVAPLVQSITSGGMSAGGAKGAAGLLTRAAGGAVSGGAMAGLVDPDSAATGALIGAAVPVALQGVKKGAQAAVNALKPDKATAKLAQKALDMGAPIGPADMSSNATVKGARSILNDNLFSGGVGQRQAAAKQSWFNRQVGKTFGAEADSLTPEVLDAAKKRMGSEFDRIWNNNNLVVDDALLGDLSRLRKSADMLPKDEMKRLLSLLDDFEGRVTAGAGGEMVIPGEVANRFQSSLRRTAEGAQGFLRNDLADLRGSVVKAFNRTVGEADAAALKGNQAAYKAFKTVEPLLNKAEVGVAGRLPGDVPAALLPQAVTNSYKGGVAGTPLAELAQMGSRFLVDRVPQTGGSAKALLQNSMVVGGLLGTGGITSPLALIGAPAAIGLNKALGSAALSRGLLAPAASHGAGLGLKVGLLSPAVRVAPLLGVDRN